MEHIDVLGVYASDEDIARQAGGDFALVERYIAVFAFKGEDMKRMAASEESFSLFKEAIRGTDEYISSAAFTKKIDDMVEKGGHGLFRIEEPQGLGTVDESADHLTMMLLANLSGLVIGEEDLAMGVGAITMRREGRIIAVNFYTQCKTPADIEALRNDVITYMKKY